MLFTDVVLLNCDAFLRMLFRILALRPPERVEMLSAVWLFLSDACIAASVWAASIASVLPLLRSS